MSELHKPTYIYRISNYVKIHEVSLALFLTAYGAFYLASVILSGWVIADWGKDITSYPPFAVNTLLPRSFVDPIFFVTSFPALIIGAVMLCSYSIHGINPKASNNKQYVAILLTAFGFTYQVIGAWPMEHTNDFPWQWQKQIAMNGPVFTWTLYLLSLIVLLIGVFSLYKHSQIYQQKHSGGEDNMANQWHSKSSEETLSELNVTIKELTTQQAQERLTHYGPNVLKKVKGKSPLKILLGQFTDILMIILLIATGLSFVVGEPTDAIIILAIVNS